MSDIFGRLMAAHLPPRGREHEVGVTLDEATKRIHIVILDKCP